MQYRNPKRRYTRSDKKILEFIEESTEEFLFMSIGQLAERLEMSEATISRFARHIGYGDFKELKSAVAQQKNRKRRGKKDGRDADEGRRI